MNKNKQKEIFNSSHLQKMVQGWKGWKGWWALEKNISLVLRKVVFKFFTVRLYANQ